MLGYGMFIFGLLGYFGRHRMLPHAHPAGFNAKIGAAVAELIKRTAILLTLGSDRTSRKGSPPLLRLTATWSWDLGIALAVALHNIPEGLAVAGPVYAATGV